MTHAQTRGGRSVSVTIAHFDLPAFSAAKATFVVVRAADACYDETRCNRIALRVGPKCGDMDNWSVPTLNLDLCIGCGLCATRCPEQVVVMEERIPAFVHPEACTYCGQCEAVCPTGAIALTYAIVWEETVSIDGR